MNLAVNRTKQATQYPLNYNPNKIYLLLSRNVYEINVYKVYKYVIGIMLQSVRPPSASLNTFVPIFVMVLAYSRTRCGGDIIKRMIVFSLTNKIFK